MKHCIEKRKSDSMKIVSISPIISSKICQAKYNNMYTILVLLRILIMLSIDCVDMSSFLGVPKCELINK